MGHSYAIQETPFAAYSQQSFPESISPTSLFAKEPPTHFLSASQTLQPARSWSYRKTPVLLVTILLACAISAVCFSAARVETEVAVSRHSLLRPQHPRDMEPSYQGSVINCHIVHSLDPMHHSSTDTAVCSEELDPLEPPEQQQLQQITVWQRPQGSSSSSSSYVSSLIGSSLGRRFSLKRRQLRLAAS